MSAIVNMYPVLTSEQKNSLGYFSEKLSLLYKENYDFFPLNLENIDGDEIAFTAEVRDPRCEWYPEKYNLILRKNIFFEDVSILFGANGIAPVNATIGVALRWMSAKSGYRGFLTFGEFTKNSKNINLNYEHSFEKDSVRGSIILETIIYLKDCGNAGLDEKHLAQQSGTVLGTLDTCELFVDGNGSVFPVSTVNDATKPLWWVYYDDSCNPLQDPFDEEFLEVRLNRAHPAFESLRIDDNLKDSPLFLEVISSALLIIIDSVKDSLGPDWDTVLNGQGYARGSIAEAINYFIVKLNWDTSSPSKLAQSVHNFFDNNLKGGTL